MWDETIGHIGMKVEDRLWLEMAGNGQASLEMIEAPRSKLRKADLVIEAKDELAGDVGGNFTRCSGRGTWALGDNKPAIQVKASVDACQLVATVVHEMFHCAHALSLGKVDREAFGEPGLWAVEGGASWSEERFLPSNNSEWSMYNCYADADQDLAPCGGPVGPLAPLAQRHNSAALYFLDMQQFGGGDAMVQGVLSTLAAGSASLAALPHAISGKGWHDFVEATTGYEPLFDPVAGVVVPVQVGPLAAQHAIIEVSAASDIDFIDVGFDQELEQGLGSADATRITAVLLSDTGAQVEAWSERWPQQADNSPDLMFGDETTAGSLRLCLARLGECESVEPLHEDLYEIRLVISNARTEPGDELRGRILLIPGTFPGWKAKEFRGGKPEGEQHETFKSFLTFNLMDRDEAEIDLYFSADGEQLEFEISRIGCVSAWQVPADRRRFHGRSAGGPVRRRRTPRVCPPSGPGGAAR